MDKADSSLTFSVWAIADLHLSFGIANKEMDIFGEEWIGWTDKLKRNWEACIAPEDLVLLPGDISWAMHPEEALPDLEWIDKLPGVKVMIRGNHDYWWGSKSKVKKLLPLSLNIIQNDAFDYNGVTVGGARLWDTPEYSFNEFVVFKEREKPGVLITNPQDPEHDRKIFTRELSRLEMSLKALDPHAHKRLVMTHYPPIGAGLADSSASKLLEEHNIDVCVFGHLHSLVPKTLPFGEKNGVRYYLTSCDYLDFKPFNLF